MMAKLEEASAHKRSGIGNLMVDLSRRDQRTKGIILHLLDTISFPNFS